MTLIVLLAADIQGVSQSEARVVLMSWVSELQPGGHFTQPAVRHTPPNLERKITFSWLLGRRQAMQCRCRARLTCEDLQSHDPQPWYGHGRVVSSGALASSNSCPFQVSRTFQVPFFVPGICDCSHLRQKTWQQTQEDVGQPVLRGPEWEAELGRLVEREAQGELQACLSMPGPASQPGSAELLTGDFPCASHSGGSPLSQ